MNINLDLINSQVTNYAQKCFKDELLYVILVGSAGKNAFIDDWSDLDYYVIIKHTDLDKIKDMNDFLKTYKIHIGITFFSEMEIKNKLLAQRCLIGFYEIQNGYDKILLKNSDLELPKIQDKDIMTGLKQEMALCLKSLRMKPIQDFRSILKEILLIYKLVLREQGIFLYNWKDIDNQILKLFPDNPFLITDLFSHRNDKNFDLYDYLQRFLVYFESHYKFKA